MIDAMQALTVLELSSSLAILAIAYRIVFGKGK